MSARLPQLDAFTPFSRPWSQPFLRRFAFLSQGTSFAIQQLKSQSKKSYGKGALITLSANPRSHDNRKTLYSAKA